MTTPIIMINSTITTVTTMMTVVGASEVVASEVAASEVAASEVAASEVAAVERKHTSGISRT